MWRPQVVALRDAYRVVTVDLPGFGPAPADIGEQSAARALAEVLAAVTDEPSHVAGLSLGGAVAIDLALTFPERVRSLTLISALLRGRPAGIRAWADAAALAKEGDLERAREAWLGDDLFASTRARPAVLASVREMARDYSCDHWRDRMTTRFEIADPASCLAEIDVPALVLVGEHDLPTFHAMADEYAAALPRATREVVSGAGHLSNLEAPESVNARLSRFFAFA
jgi:pimeloyl-ACP methyl ester carboxylesterase